MTLSGDTPPRRRREGWCELRWKTVVWTSGVDKWGGQVGPVRSKEATAVFSGPSHYYRTSPGTILLLPQ